MSALDNDWSQVDVAVVGGSIAGCVTAIRFHQMGHRVAIFDKKPMDDHHHKRLCTHFIQPHATPILARLGLGHLHEAGSSVPTKAVFVTPGGVIEGPGGYLPDQQDAHALNLERRVLDPALRAAARAQGVHYVDTTGVERITQDESGWIVDTLGEGGPRRYRAHLVVAADGRRSRLAKELGNPTEEHPNERAALFGYFSGIETRDDDRSVFIMHDRDLACVYPLVGDRTQLVLFAEKSRVEDWGHGEDRLRHFLEYFDAMPEAPSMADAVPEGPLLGYSDYPSQVRQPAVGTVPFVGDAVVSLDAMAGVGCGFALVSADLLASSFEGRPLTRKGIEDGVDDYRKRFADTISPHVEGICVDARVEKNEVARQRMFQTICGSEELSQQYLALTGRMLLPSDFQRALVRTMMTRGKAVAKG